MVGGRLDGSCLVQFLTEWMRDEITEVMQLCQWLLS
jgi:hypothetical protein